MYEVEIREMLEMQDAMNSKVHPQWREQNFEWSRAILVESVELMEHVGWKWWKKQQPNMQQIKLELVDIWHFIMSDMLCFQDMDTLVDVIQSCIPDKGLIHEFTDKEDFLADIELLMAYTLDGTPIVSLFWSLVFEVGMDFEELYKLYVGKNVLNFFRQDNGYKEGNYIKVWGGREDNEHLIDILNNITEIDSLQYHISNELQKRYPKQS